MRSILALTLMAGLCAASAIVVTAGQQARPVSTAPTTIEEVLKAVRSDLQGERADIIAKNVTLSSEQAAKFWPVFSAYQKEQDAIMDQQLKGLQLFIEGYDKMDDAAALGLITAHLDRDAKMVTLRKDWLPKFQQALGTKLAVRVMQIDRRLSLAHQIQFAAKIPLAQ